MTEREDSDRGKGPLVDLTSSSLIESVKQQQNDGWERFVRTYGPIIYGWCRRVDLQPADAADIVQDVFRSVAKGIVRFQKSEQEAGFRRWLRTVTSSRINDFHRRNKRVQPGVGGSSAAARLTQAPDPVDSLAPWTGIVTREQLSAAMETVRRQVGECTWRAFEMVFFEQYRATEAAAALNLSPDSVRMAKYRILTRLRDLLRSDPDSST